VSRSRLETEFEAKKSHRRILKIRLMSRCKRVFLASLFCLAGSLTGQQLTEVAFETIQLSYIETDRAAGILRALGYNVISFEAVEGTNPNELSIFPSQDSPATLLNGMSTNLADLPIIIPLPETGNITLLEMQAEAAGGVGEMGVELGGASLVLNTSGEPLQRMMICYDPNDPATLSRLIHLLTNEIDVSAVQVIIEALVIEIDSEKIDQLGINFATEGSLYSTSFPEPIVETGAFAPYSFVLDKSLLGAALDIEAKLQALVSSKEADILSRPSVLVLDGRQARIVVGQQIPVSQSTATGQNVVSSTEYIPVGIVLNLRPRVSRDRSAVTIQVETIISEAAERIGIGSIGSDVLSAPVFNSRKVQTYVQVANRTPFIIGGLISKKESDQVGRVPILGSIPLLGKLFSAQKRTDKRREVIVVITPNLVDVQQRNFTRVIPKDSEIFNNLGNMLFQNSYRVQNSDVYDFGFVYSNKLYRDTEASIEALRSEVVEAQTDPALNALLEGALPGQEVMIRRMLYDVVERIGYYKHILPERIIYFTGDPHDPTSVEVNNFAGEYTQFLKSDAKRGKGFVLSFHPDRADPSAKHLRRPISEKIFYDLDGDGDYLKMLRDQNLIPDEPSVMIYSSQHERRLYEVMVLRRIIEMNPDLLGNISLFRPGIEIIFPAPETLASDVHVLDLEVARYFYEVNDYNNVFDSAFLAGMEEINSIIDGYYK